MQDLKQTITIKGTRDGLSLFIDEDASFADVLRELEDKIQSSKPKEDEPVVSVKVKLGNRYVDEEKEAKIRSIITTDERFQVIGIDSNLIPINDAKRWMDESEVKVINRVVRSGQVLDIHGDILLVGDVNPGGKIVATGNIYIMGSLYGIAHAGCNGDQEAFIAASYMKPSQLRIADYISRAPDYEADGVYMECGIIDTDQDKITIDSLKVLSKKRKEISGFERRMKNG